MIFDNIKEQITIQAVNEGRWIYNLQLIVSMG